MTTALEATGLQVVPSGVPGLDDVLQGGFLSGAVYIVQGDPGAGKTILGNQLCYNHVREVGGSALYVTLLAESHARMMAHLSSMSFFDAKAVPTHIYYFSAFRVLEEDGLKGLLTLLRREVQARGATLVVLDGLVAAEESAGTPREFKKFIHELQTVAALSESTMFLLTSSGATNMPVSAEHTMVDGVLEMRRRLYGRRAERELIVHKRRGGPFLSGRHSFRITSDGVTVYPRTEAALAQPTRGEQPASFRLSLGVERLDAMLGGGMTGPSTAMIVGPPGVGKTTLGLHFLGAGSAEEPGLLFSFYETPEAVRRQAELLNLPLGERIDAGAVEVLWQPPTEGVLDEVADRLLAAVKRRGVRRLFIDGMEGFEQIAVEPERVKPLMNALVNELQAMGVTTLITDENDFSATAGSQLLSGLKLKGASAIAETIVVMRYAELRSNIYRMISVLKSRNSRIDREVRLFGTTDRGLVIEADSDSAEAVLAELQGSQVKRSEA